ncbi:MAG: GtrA family protein [Oscillospiraceae bacterium]
MSAKIKELYKKYEDMVLYIIFGVLTTIVSYASYFIARIAMPVATANIISWICAVTFAFITNKKYVFKSKTDTAKAWITEAMSFYAARLLTGLVETVIMALCADKYSEFFCSLFGVTQTVNEIIFKIIANVIILIMNYVISKLVIFRKKDSISDKTEAENN